MRSPDEVFNQPPPRVGIDLWGTDTVLRECVEREGGGFIAEEAGRLGRWAGSAETLELGELANRHTPELRTHDRFGHRADRVEFHPAWHELMRVGVACGSHSLAWESREGGHVARLALMYLRHQVDEGSSCPLTMTFAVVPSLREEPRLAELWEPRVLSREYDPRFVPAGEKRGVLFGMAMTERQGGSDVRSNTTRARADGEHEGVPVYRLTGHKWFCSAPMCDAFLMLAQAEGGLSCFLIPRFLPDGSVNAMRLMRLKDKLGNRSNASSEIELHDAWAQRLGEEGRGVATIIEMVRHTRLDCVVGSAATLRRAVAEALHHIRHRRAFGKRLIDQPLMRNVLADLALESEAATTLAFRLARAFDRGESAFARIATAIGKFWVCKRAIAGVSEALETLGGNGYVEEGPLARLHRDIPLNSIWEGSGNVQCLDVLRTARREPETIEALIDELRVAGGSDPRYDAHLLRLQDLWSSVDEAAARTLVEESALALQGALLLRHAPHAVADLFCASRLDPPRHLVAGCLPSGVDLESLLKRAAG